MFSLLCLLRDLLVCDLLVRRTLEACFLSGSSYRCNEVGSYRKAKFRHVQILNQGITLNLKLEGQSLNLANEVAG